MSLKYVYHWCAASKRLAGTHLSDGIAHTDEPVITQEGLQELTRKIAELHGRKPEDTVLTSLTLLHTIYPEAQEVIHG